MEKEVARYILIMFLITLFVPITVGANVVWPSLYILNGIMSWYIILAGLVIEILFIKFIIKPTWFKSIIISVSMNAASAVIGLFAIPFSGILAEFAMAPFNSSTFATSQWVVSYILAVICNVVVEGLFLKWLFKLKFKNNLKWLLIANALSVVLAIMMLGFHMEL